MKRLWYAALLCLLSLSAFADVLEGPIKYGTWTAMRGTANVKTGLASSTLCWAANKADAESRKVKSAVTYKCRYEDTRAETYSDACGPQPADLVQIKSCPATSVPGTWVQNQAYVNAAKPACWAQSGTWSPATPSTTACPPLAVKPTDPALFSQTVQCSASNPGTTGTWQQTQDFVYDAASNTFKPTGWTPTAAPANACAAAVPPKPADNTRTKTCDAPTVGSYPQVQTSTYDKASNTWVFGAWTPEFAPTGACTTPATSLIPVVDKSKIPAAAVGFSGPRIQVAPYPFNSFATPATKDLPALPVGPQAPNPADIGAFRLGAQYSHMLFDDPIVFPGLFGASHLHVFFCNTGANAASTTVSIATTGNSTCAGGTLNRTSYWAPAMIDTTDGSPVQPTALLVYYKTGYGGVKPADVRAVPNGLRMINGIASGNPTNPSGAGRFACVGGDKGVGWQTTIPTNCYQNNSLIMEVDFPQCWDGVNLDSPDHKSHMHEATGSGCPASHPVPLPAIAYEIYYDLAKVTLSRMAKWRLASDNYAATSPGGYSAHGDYLMGWDPATMTKIIKNCDNPSMDCHANLLGDGTWLY